MLENTQKQNVFLEIYHAFVLFIVFLLLILTTFKLLILTTNITKDEVL